MTQTPNYLHKLENPSFDNEEETDFIKMVRRKYTNVVQAMIKLNAKIDTDNIIKEKHPLHIALKNKDIKMLSILISA